jgi:S-(hydroxymethyl)glutathione dehydrogenase/alcohol dehydrogenase
MIEGARAARAVLSRALGAPVTVESITVDPPQAGEVMVKISACGVCHSDLSATNGYFPIELPMILGHEAAGVIVAVGSGVRDFAPSDHIVSSFLYMCGECRYCRAGRPVLCVDQGKALKTLPDGSSRTRDAQGRPLNIFCGCGVMAEYATLSVHNVVKIASDVPLDRAALVGCAVTTGVGAVFNTARVRPGSSVLVIGCGGVGLNVIQGAVIAGAASIVALDSVQGKLELARRFGATETVLATDEDWIRPLKRRTSGGPDYAFECVGGGELAGLAYRAVGRGGVAVVVGVSKPEEVTSVRTISLPFEEKTLTGSYFGSCVPQVDFPRILALYAAGRLKLDELITRRYTIEDAPAAFADLAASKNARGLITF